MITLVEIKGPQSSKGLKHPLPWSHLVLPSAPGRQCWVALLCHAVGPTLIQEEEGLRVRICCQVARTPYWIFWERRKRASCVFLRVSFSWHLGRLRRASRSLGWVQEHPGTAWSSSWISRAGHEGEVQVAPIAKQWAREEDSSVWPEEPRPNVGSAVRGNERAPSLCSYHTFVPVPSL